MVGHNLNETLLQLIARKATGKGTLINLSVTENGNYDPADEDPPVDGYNYVSVSVETYEDELAQALEDLAAAQAALAEMQQCCADVATILGATPSQGQSCCDAVKEKAQETVDENTEYEECCAIVAILVGLDPTDPNFDPSDVPPAVENTKGYEFPSGTPYDPDIVSVVGDASVEDVTLGITLTWKYTDYHESGPAAGEPYGIEWGYIQNGTYNYLTSTRNTVYNSVLTCKYIKMIDPSTGEVEIAWDYTYTDSSQVWHQTATRTEADLIGFGASGHTFKAKNV